MSWSDFRARREAIETVLDHASEHGELSHALVAEVFPTRADLVLALHYEWTLALWAQVDLALCESLPTPPAERAWAETERLNPVLSWVLNQHLHEAGPRVVAALARERAIMTTAGEPNWKRMPLAA